VNLSSQKQATLYALLAVLCWSTVATAFKLSLQYLSPMQLMLVATVASWVFFVAVLLFRGRVFELFDQAPHVYLHSLLFGLMNPVLYYWLLFSAYERLPAQEAQAINYSWAIVMSLLAVPLLKHRISKFDLLAALLCYFGVLVIATRGDVLALEFENLSGVLLALASTLVWSGYWIFNRRDPREPVLGLCLNFSFALPALLVLCYMLDELNIDLAWQGAAGGVYVGVVEMGLAFVLWLLAMKKAERTAPIANLIFISPFLSLALISVFLKEAIYTSTVLGLSLIVLGLVIQQHFAQKLSD